MDIKDVLEEAYKTHSISLITYEQKQEIAKMYQESFGEKLQTNCPRCVISGCIRLYNYKIQNNGKRSKKR